MPIEIAPSILSADFSCLLEEIERIEKEVKVLHLDIMDGHFVPNLSFGPPVIKSLRDKFKLFFDAHLMIDNPEDYLADYKQAGADRITVHVETVKDVGVLEEIKSWGLEAGIAINPDTPLRKAKKFLEEANYVLVMSVMPGFGGQSFKPGALAKIEKLRRLKDKKGYNYIIGVDGGINLNNIQKVAKAGAEEIIVGSALMRAEDPVSVLRNMKEEIGV